MARKRTRPSARRPSEAHRSRLGRRRLAGTWPPTFCGFATALCSAAWLEWQAPRRGETQTVAPALVRAAGGAARTGVVVAEGDSWFDYPWHEVLRMLEDQHGYDVESVAHRGDTVESMAYTGQLEEFARVIEKLLRQNTIPNVILLSGGGNDIAAISSRC